MDEVGTETPRPDEHGKSSKGFRVEGSLFDARPRVGQLHDDVVMRLVLHPATAEWAEDLLLGDDDHYGVVDTAERTAEGLVLTRRILGNVNALGNARSWLQDVEDALEEGDIDPMIFTLEAWSEESSDV